MEYNWNLLKDGTELSSNLGNYGILILNMKIKIKPSFMSTLWKNAAWRITVDGGTDWWLDYTRKHNLSLEMPDQITGDFDSIKPETLEFFKSQRNVSVVETPDQDYTDFDNALKCLFESSKTKIDSYLVILEHSGRLDKTFADVNTLSYKDVPGYMLTSTSITWLLPPGTHHIDIPLYLRQSSAWCAILPFHSSKIMSSGLKWNLGNRTVEFGGLISSSNTYDGSPVVTITNEKTVIWSMSLGDRYA